MTQYTSDQIRARISSFDAPKRARYPELAEYTRDEIYKDFFGGGGLYLAAHMTRTLRLQQMDWGRTQRPRKTLFVLTAHQC